MLQTKSNKDQKHSLKWLLSAYRTYEEHYSSDPVKFDFARKSLDAWGIRYVLSYRGLSRSEAAASCRRVRRLEDRGLIRRRDQVHDRYCGNSRFMTRLQLTVEGRAWQRPQRETVNKSQRERSGRGVNRL